MVEPAKNTKTLIQILHDHGVDTRPDLIDELYLFVESVRFWRYSEGYDAGYKRGATGYPHEYNPDFWKNY